MSVITKTWGVRRSGLAVRRESDNLSAGAGKDKHLPVGFQASWSTSGGRCRSFVNFWRDAGTGRQLKSGDLILSGTESHHSKGGSAYVRIDRINQDWESGTLGDDEAWYSSNALEWDTMPTVTGSFVVAAGKPSGSTLRVDVSVILEATLPNDILKRNGVDYCNGADWYGLRLAACDSSGTLIEDSSSRYSEYASDNHGTASKRPKMEVEFYDNLPPLTPTALSPATQADGSPAIVNPGGEVTVTFDFQDPDEGDLPGKIDVEIYPDTATDDLNGNVLTGVLVLGLYGVAVSPAPTSPTAPATYRAQYRVTGLAAGTIYRARLRVADNDPTPRYSGWTRLGAVASTNDTNAAMRFRTNSSPNGIVNFRVDPDVASPHFTGALSDPDSGATIGGLEIQVYEYVNLAQLFLVNATTDVGGTGALTGGYVGGTVFDEQPSIELEEGHHYYARARLQDQYGQPGAWTTIDWTYIKATGPTNLVPRDTSTKQTSKTPTLYLGHSSNFTTYEAYVYNNVEGLGTPLATFGPGAAALSTTLAAAASLGASNIKVVSVTGAAVGDQIDVNGELVTITVVGTAGAGGTGITFTPVLAAGKSSSDPVGTRIKALSVPAGAGLTWGQTAYWKARVNAGEYSQLYPFYINDLPKAPDIRLYATDLLTSASLGTTVATKGTAPVLWPWLRIPFDDPDLAAYSEITQRRELEVKRDSDGVLLARFVMHAGVSDDWRLGYFPKIYQGSWTAASNHTVTSEFVTVPTGYDYAAKIAVAAQPLSTTRETKGPLWNGGSGGGLVYTDLSHASLTTLKAEIRASAIGGNLSSIQLRFYFSGNDANYAGFTITPSSAGAWETKSLTKGSPNATGGSVNWAQVHRMGVTVITGAGGTYTGDVYLGRVWLDPFAVLDSTYRLRARDMDNNSSSEWGPYSTTRYLKTSALPVVAIVGTVDQTDPTPLLDYSFTGSGGKAQAKRRLLLYRRRDHHAMILNSRGLQSYWRLNEPSGSFADSKGAIAGTANGTITRNVTGVLSPADTNGAADLDGTSGYITFGDNYDFAGVLPFTALGWVNLDTLPAAASQEAIIGKESATGGWWVYVIDTSGLRVRRTDSGGAFDQLNDVGLVSTGTWHQVGMTYDGSTIRAYVDGAEVGNVASTRSLAGNANNLALGRQANGTAGWIDGKVDEWGIWNRALAADELAAFYAARLQSSSEELVYDSGWVTTADTAPILPALILEDNVAYRWEIQAADTDGLVGVLT